MRFLGLRNYERALTDPVVWDRLTTTALFVLLTVTAQMVIGFLLALLFSKQFPLRRYLLILVLTPMMLSFVAVGAFFRYYYDPTFGLVSQFVNLFTDERFVLVSSTAGADDRDRDRRRLDVGALRDAAGARRASSACPNISTRPRPSTGCRTGGASGRSPSPT